MQYIVNVSGGLTSFEALDRTLERFGKANTLAIFADTRIEDAGVYQLLDDSERYFGIKILRLSDGRDVFDVWKDERVISIGAFAPCSQVLKRDPIEAWIKANLEPESYTRVFGYEALEADRMERLAAQVAPDPVWFPLAEKPYVDKCWIAAKLERLGIAVPPLYALGFEHNNCGGGCVKAGIAHWAHLYAALPERFAMWEQKEADIREYLGKDIAILSDRRGGDRVPLTLTELRRRLDAGEDYDKNDWGGCGCFSQEPQGRMEEMLIQVELVPRRKK